MASNIPDDENQPPTIEERYTGATHASNLRVEPERGGSADVIIAMAMSQARLGGALIRLHSEWDRCEKPTKPTAERTRAVFLSMKPAYIPLILSANAYTRCQQEDLRRRQAQAPIETHKWYMHELKLLFQKLKTMPEVRQELVLWARQKGIADAEHRVAEMLVWWLDHVCPRCEGRKKQLIAGTPHKSHKDCDLCHGTGEVPLPYSYDHSSYQRESKMIAKYISDCTNNAQSLLGQQLPDMRRAKRFAAGIVDNQETS